MALPLRPPALAVTLKPGAFDMGFRSITVLFIQRHLATTARVHLHLRQELMPNYVKTV